MSRKLHLQEIPLHDPFVFACEKTQTYYLYNSARIMAEDKLDRFGVKVYTSTDLINWEPPRIVFEIPDGIWANPKHGAWAPEVHLYQGRYYLFVTLHNRDRIMKQPPQSRELNHWRGTVIAVSDSLFGPFKLLKTDEPYPHREFMTLDGTLFVDEFDQPWMVYCHEWVQILDGTVEAVKLQPDLAGTIAEPIHLFKGSDAPWINAERVPEAREYIYVTDGPQLYRTYRDELLMLWSSYNRDGYVQTLARSETGKLEGPWVQLEPLVYEDSGHGMLFQTFKGELMLILHSPFEMPRSRAHIYRMEDTGTNLNVIERII